MTINFTSALARLAEGAPAAHTALLTRLRTCVRAKGELILQPGNACTHISIIQTGVVRHFRYDEDGKEHSTWFSFPGDGAVAMKSFVMGGPSQEGMEALTDCEMQLISQADLEELTRAHHPLETLYRKLLEQYFIDLEERLNRIQILSAAQKYRHMINERPQLLREIPHYHLASFLGVTKETLSRIRQKHR